MNCDKSMALSILVMVLMSCSKPSGDIGLRAKAQQLAEADLSVYTYGNHVCVVNEHKNSGDSVHNIMSCLGLKSANKIIDFTHNDYGGLACTIDDRHVLNCYVNNQFQIPMYTKVGVKDVVAGFTFFCYLDQQGSLYCPRKGKSALSVENMSFKSIRGSKNIICGKTSNDQLMCYRVQINKLIPVFKELKPIQSYASTRRFICYEQKNIQEVTCLELDDSDYDNGYKYIAIDLKKVTTLNVKTVGSNSNVMCFYSESEGQCMDSKQLEPKTFGLPRFGRVAKFDLDSVY